MKKLLRNSYSKFSATLAVLTNNLFTGKKLSFVLPSLFTLLLVVGFNQQSHAQTVYYLGSDGSVSNGTNDGIYKVNQDGSGLTRVCNSVSAPQDMALDIPNNRAFVSSFTPNAADELTPNGIYRIDLGTGTKTRIVATNTSFRAANLVYDPVNDYLYYTSNDGNGSTTVATDGLYRIKGDGSGNTTLASSISATPTYFGVDIPNSKIYIYESVTTAPKLMTYNLSGNSATFTGSINMPVIKGMDYDPVNNWIYYTVDNGTTALTTDDALWKIHPNGTNQTKVIGNLTANPGIVTVERVNNIAFVWNSTVGDRRIVKVDIASGTQSSFPISPGFNVSNQVAAIAIPAASKVATLANFTINSGTLSPGFSSGTIAYTASVAYNVSSINVTPTRTDNFASIKVNGATATSGSATAIALNFGDNIITTVVTAEDGLTTKTYTLTVNRAKAPQTITFNALAAKTYGAADFAPGATASSGLGVSYSSDNTNVATIVSGQIHIVGAGTANITASQAGDGNTLAASNVVQALTVNKASQTITFAGTATKTYGNADYAPGATTNSGLTVSYSSDNASVATIVSNQVHIVGQGTANITASQAGDGNRLAATSVVQSLTVGKATVTVTAVAKTKVYGDTDPALTFTATGVVGSDAPTGALTRATGTTIGDYPISQGSLTYGNNYNLTFVPANLTITKRPLTIAPLPVTKVYGTNDFANGAPYSFNGTSIAPGEGMTGLFGRDNTSENVGVYALTKGVKRPVNVNNGDDMSANYNITFITNTFTITAKPITVSATAQTKTYGEADPELTYSNSGLAFSDTFTGALTRSAGENFGTYAISQGSLLAGSNYTLSFTANNLTIAKKIVNVTANAKTKTYGDVDPALDYIADALAFSDAFTGSLTRVAGENIGAYAISQGSLALNSNYMLNFTGADFNIGTKTVNVTANAATKTYGEADPALTYNADALVSGDAFTGSITRTAGELAGSYPITQGSLALNSNYALNYTGANLTIDKREVTINALALNVPYGDADVTIGYNITGSALVTGDIITGALSRAAGTAIGTYAVTQGSLTLSNSNSYNLTFNSSPYNIIARPITISSPFTTKLYGDADPALSYGITSGSLLAGDALSGALLRDAGENSGPYAVRQGTVAVNSSNYNVTYQLGNFEIDRVPLTITADNKTKLVNAPNPTFTYAITGFKNGDDESALNSPVTFFNLPLSSAPAGTYSIDLSNVGAQNYDVTQQSGVLTIREASANANLAALSVAEGAIAPTFDAATTSYSLSVGADVNQVNVTATLADLNAKLFRINGFGATSGEPSNISVYPGDNEIQVLVTAEDNSTSNTYTINVSKPLDTNSKLAGIYLQYDETFNQVPAFDPEVHAYTVNLPNEVTGTRIIPFTAAQYAFIKINGTPYEGYYGSGLLIPGEDNNFSIEVFAQDRTVSETYTLNLKRAISANNKLSALTISAGTLSPSFNTDVLSYTTTVAGNVTSIDVQGFVSDTTARYKVNGNTLPNRYQPYTVALAEGQNTITLEVTAKNGDIRNYALDVTRLAFPDIKLQSLAINKGTLAPAFLPNTLTYDVTVPNTEETLVLTPVAAVNTATVQIGATTINASTPTATVNLTEGLNNIDIVVTAADGVSKQTYTVRVTRGLSDNTNADLKISPKANLVQISATVTDVYYTYAVAPDVSSITLTPKARNLNATMQVNGLAIASDSTSAPITLNMGPTVVNLVVTAQNGVNTRTYHITVNRTGSNVANLLTLKLTPTATLTKGAASATDVNYTTTVAPDVTSVMLTSVLQDLNSTMKVNGTNVASGAASNPIALNIGQTVIDVIVTAQDGITTRAYHVTVSRTGSNVANATIIRLTPTSTLVKGAVSLTDINYTCTVAPNVNTVTLTSILQDENSTMKVNGSAVANGVASAPIVLNIGQTVINLVVTAQDGVTTRAYHITVNRTGANIANASILRLTPASTLVKGTVSLTEVNYTSTVAVNTGSVTLTAIAQDLNSTMTINGSPVASGSPSAPILLSTGQTVIELVVTAQDGVTKRTYFVTVNRPTPVLLAVDKTDSNMFTNKPTNSFAPTGDDGVVVHKGVSPNGDGANDFLYIEGISAYAGNKLSIMNTSGSLVFETKDYGKDGNNLFNGHSNKNGTQLKPGTYYYVLEYQVEKTTKRKTGYIILKF
ncbi:gliding motility-associated-like protein [Mucilaginibacter sp. UYNi724]